MLPVVLSQLVLTCVTIFRLAQLFHKLQEVTVLLPCKDRFLTFL